jgi:hypothetical protein
MSLKRIARSWTGQTIWDSRPRIVLDARPLSDPEDLDVNARRPGERQIMVEKAHAGNLEAKCKS